MLHLKAYNKFGVKVAEIHKSMIEGSAPWRVKILATEVTYLPSTLACAKKLAWIFGSATCFSSATVKERNRRQKITRTKRIRSHRGRPLISVHGYMDRLRG